MLYCNWIIVVFIKKCSTLYFIICAVLKIELFASRYRRVYLFIYTIHVDLFVYINVRITKYIYRKICFSYNTCINI